MRNKIRSSNRLAFLALTSAVLLISTGTSSAQTYSVVLVDDTGADFSYTARVNSSAQVLGTLIPSSPLMQRPFLWTPGIGTQEFGLPPDALLAYCSDLNDAGVVTGWSVGTSMAEAFVWDATSGLEGLGTLPGGVYSIASGINSAGQVVGFGDTGGDSRAFLWDAANGMQNLGVLPGGTTSIAYAINDAGQVTGGSGTASGERGFLWDPVDGMQSVGILPGALRSTAYAINGAGQVVGTCQFPTSTRAFIWDAANGIQDIGTLGGVGSSVQFSTLFSPFTVVRSINDAGQVIGYSDTAGGDTHAFLWDTANGIQDLGVLPGGTTSVPSAINWSGWVVGYGTIAENPGTSGILWKPSATKSAEVVDLNSLVDPASDWHVMFAVDINDVGDIAGIGFKDPDLRGILLKRARYTLTTATQGLGAIVPSPGTYTYIENTEVTLSASPGPGWFFDHWEGDLAGSQNPITITMDVDKSVTAVFESTLPPDAFVTLTMSADGVGDTNPPIGVNLFATGTDLEVFAYPAYGWKFSHWEGAVSSPLNPIKVSLYANSSLNAVFLQTNPFQCEGLPNAASPTSWDSVALLALCAGALFAIALLRGRHSSRGRAD